MDLKLYVWDHDLTNKISVYVADATSADLRATKNWQTKWTSKYARALPNKVALHTTDRHELLGLMSYDIDEVGLAVEVIYLESADHSNSNLLRETGCEKKYIGIAKALLAYAAMVSMDAGYDGVLYFKAKTTELREYYIREFGAMPLGSYDPFRLAIWEDEAAALVNEFI